MTREEAQRAYDAAGSIAAYAAAEKIPPPTAYKRLRKAGVRFKPQGGWHGNQWSPEAIQRNRERRAARLRLGLPLKTEREISSVRYCAERGGIACRKHALPDACEICRAPHLASCAGLGSSLTVNAEGRQRWNGGMWK